MKANKSIDGLTTREAKINVSRKKAPQISTKSSIPLASDFDSTKYQDKNTTLVEETVTETETITESTPVTSEQAVEDFLSPVQAFEFDEDSGDLKKVAPTPTTHQNDSERPEEKPMKEGKPQKSKKTKKKPSKGRRIAGVIALVIVIILIGGVTWAIFWGNDIIAKITGGQGNVLDLLSITSETYEPLKTDANGRTNILAFGTSGYNMEGETGDSTHDGAQLTDSIMMISLNQETGDIAMLSLPRDLKVPGACYAGKLNEVYTCNNDNGNDETAGATALMSEVGTVLGIDFQYYAHLNWGSLVSIVDTLGGIKVTLDEDIADYGWTDAVFEAGVEYTINGEEALGLARARHGTMGGDFTRGTSQQKILIGIKNAVFEKNLSISDLLSLASTLGDNLRTNFSISDLKTLAHLTYEFDFDSMRQIALIDYMNGIYYMTTGMINGVSYVIPSAGEGNYGEIQEFIAEQLSNDPRVYEKASIIVLNSTDQAGIAGSERAKLIEDGYTDVTADNAPEDVSTTSKYTIYMNGDKISGTADMLSKLYGVTVLPISDAPDSITRDYNFVIILGGPKTDESSTAPTTN